MWLEAARNVDWEALGRGDCPEGTCLYVADVGDNQIDRADPAIYRLPEPPPVSDTVSADRLPVRYPDGPRDVEALFALPGEELYLVTKGRQHTVTLYRYPPPLRPDEQVTLQEVQRFGDGPRDLSRQVTGASADPAGRIVAVRTYGNLVFHRVEQGRLVRIPRGQVNLTTLREAQGEAVAVGPDGRVALMSEAGPLGNAGGLRFLRCPGVGAG